MPLFLNAFTLSQSELSNYFTNVGPHLEKIKRQGNVSAVCFYEKCTGNFPSVVNQQIKNFQKGCAVHILIFIFWSSPSFIQIWIIVHIIVRNQNMWMWYGSQVTRKGNDQTWCFWNGPRAWDVLLELVDLTCAWSVPELDNSLG